MTVRPQRSAPGRSRDRKVPPVHEPSAPISGQSPAASPARDDGHRALSGSCVEVLERAATQLIALRRAGSPLGPL